MRRNPKAYLWDAREAARTIADFIDGVDEATYLGSPLLRSGVERQLEILGEALNQLEKAAPAIAARVPDLRSAVDLRNVLIHGYAKLNQRIIWATAQEDVPRLRAALEEILRSLESP